MEAFHIGGKGLLWCYFLTLMVILLAIAVSYEGTCAMPKRNLKRGTHKCSPDEFFCSDEKATCIPSDRFCDGFIDCENGADETRFTDEYPPQIGVICMRTDANTNDTINSCLLFDDWICDGVRNQCVADTDEHCWNSPNNDCYIHRNYRCDGFEDCPGGQDEIGCRYYYCLAPVQYSPFSNISTNVSSEQFNASSSEYIQISEGMLCNGVADCAMDMDECYAGCSDLCMCQAIYGTCEENILCQEPDLPQCILCFDNSQAILTTQLCDGKYDCDDWSDEQDCADFQCSNGQNVSQHQLCDGVPDCLDWTDECFCSSEKTFTCQNTRCISDEKTCNGMDDCGDGSDECLPKCHPRNKFICGNGNCIARSSFCDGNDDCSDGSDEIPIESSAPGRDPAHVACSNSQNLVDKMCLLVQKDWYCDLADHCHDRADECQSDCTNSFRCDGGKCLSIESFCDDIPDCRDGSDERLIRTDNDNVTSCQNIVGSSRKTCALASDHEWICDGLVHCEARDDECASNCKHFYKCRSGECIPRDQVCDGVRECQDGSDENVETGHRFLCVKSRLGVSRNCYLPLEIASDTVADCDRDSDVGGAILRTALEQTYDNVSYLNDVVPSKFHRCLGEPLIIPAFKVCDGIIDCRLMSDECFCENSPDACRRLCVAGLSSKSTSDCAGCDAGEVSCAADSSCINATQICDHKWDCTDGVDEKDCKLYRDVCALDEDACEIHLCQNGAKAIRCDGNIECDQFSDECQEACKTESNGFTLPPYCKNVTEQRVNGFLVRSYSCGEGSKLLKGPNVCDGVNFDCQDKRDEMGCPNRIYCNESYAQNSSSLSSAYREDIKTLDSGAIHIDESQICDGRVDCKNSEDELNCTQHFYCENRMPLFVPLQSVMDGKQDCTDGSDECPAESFDSDTFASRENMLRSYALRTMVWVMGILSTAGNVTVLIETLNDSRKSGKRFYTKRPFAKVHYILVLNLAVADLLMGIYLLMLGAKSIATHGTYCKEDKTWRASAMCTSLGTLTVTSSVTSILILAIMTSYRLLAVLKPFDCQTFSSTKTIFLAGLSWGIGIMLGFLPRTESLSDYFVDQLWVMNKFPFYRGITDKNNLTRILALLSMYAAGGNKTDPARQGAEWEELTMELHSRLGHDIIRGRFGYYSTHSVCLPKLFVSMDDVGWKYSLALVTFIFLAFLYVMGAYIFICASSAKSGNPRNARQAQMHRRITYLVASDVLCWVPICALAYLTLAKVEISKQVYAVSAIVLLPINSALNPLLYSDVIQKQLERLKIKIARSVCGKNIKSRYSRRMLRRSSRLSITTKGSTRCFRTTYNLGKSKGSLENILMKTRPKRVMVSLAKPAPIRKASERDRSSVYDNVRHSLDGLSLDGENHFHSV